MHRLFVAIRPPASVRARLVAAMGGVEGARWQDDAQLRLTLRFIGEIDRHVAADVAAALAAVRHPRLTIATAQLGQFGRKGRIDSLWIGVTPHDALAALHRKIDQALVRIGLPAEGRAYLPHITLARCGRGAEPLDALTARAGELAGLSFEVEDFRLYESSLGREGARYAAMARYPLD